MKTFYLLLLFIFETFVTNSQIHFTKFKSAKYRTVPIQAGSLQDDSTVFDVIDFNKVSKLKETKIYLRHSKGDSSSILIYQKKKLIQTITLPFGFWLIDYDDCFVAGLDNNKKRDIKLIIEGGGSGLAGELSHKIYLFN
jgi:hypothetical protein